jgi:hypothetical protein
VAQAQPVTVGSPTQNNDQQVVTGQAGSQTAGGGGVVVGPVTQSGSNFASTSANNSQTTNSFGGVVVGSPAENSTQAIGTAQTIGQAANGGGGVHVGSTHQTASNSAINTASNSQTMSAAVVVGSPKQSNDQQVVTGQLVSQDPGGVIVGSVTQFGGNFASTTASNTQTLGSTSAVVVGSPTQNNTQEVGTPQVIGQAVGSNGGVLVGSVSQSQSNSNIVTVSNSQTG